MTDDEETDQDSISLEEMGGCLYLFNKIKPTKCIGVFGEMIEDSLDGRILFDDERRAPRGPITCRFFACHMSRPSSDCPTRVGLSPSSDSFD